MKGKVLKTGILYLKEGAKKYSIEISQLCVFYFFAPRFTISDLCLQKFFLISRTKRVGIFYLAGYFGNYRASKEQWRTNPVFKGYTSIIDCIVERKEVYDRAGDLSPWFQGPILQ